MTFQTSTLLTELSAVVQTSLLAAEEMKKTGLPKLNYHPQAGAWSALQCIEHLNKYGDYYLKEIEQRMNASGYPRSQVFISGKIGNYFAGLMQEQNGKIKKMKTVAAMQPVSGELSYATLDRFIKQCRYLLILLDKAYSIDLTRTKTSIALSRLIKLRLGDTLRFLVYHIQRHTNQATRACELANSFFPEYIAERA